MFTSLILFYSVLKFKLQLLSRARDIQCKQFIVEPEYGAKYIYIYCIIL